MESIIMIEGNVNYKITLDPGVWIFDDRRVDLLTYFQSGTSTTDDLTEYTKQVSKQWDREIQEGAIFPPTLKTEKKFEKEKVLTGTFGIPFHYFLENSEPLESSHSVSIITDTESIDVTIDEAYKAILGYSNNGKPLHEDGPLHYYYGDGSNKENPIKNVRKFIVK